MTSHQSAAPSEAAPALAPNYPRRRLIAALLLVAVLFLGYALAVGLTPLPQLTATADSGVERAVSAGTDQEAQAVVDAQRYPTAIGWADGSEIWANSDEKLVLASITKLVTLLVGQEAAPLAPGEAGPSYTWSEADVARQAEYRAQNGLTFPVPVGTEFTRAELLTMSMVPSANEYATAYAYEIFGDHAGFVTAVEAWATKHQLDSLRIVEPSGMSEDNVGTVSDLVRIARLAVQDETVLSYTGIVSAEMPGGIGEVNNSNRLLGELDGVIGLKTGSLDAAGFNILLAQTQDAFGREVTKITANLARPTRELRLQSGREVLAAMTPLPREIPMVQSGSRVATVTTWQGEEVSLVVEGSLSTVLTPAESASTALNIDAISAASAAATSPAADDTKNGASAGSTDSAQQVGTLTATSPTGETELPVVAATEISAPNLWWRLTHPAIVFGWQPVT